MVGFQHLKEQISETVHSIDKIKIKEALVEEGKKQHHHMSIRAFGYKNGIHSGAQGSSNIYKNLIEKIYKKLYEIGFDEKIFDFKKYYNQWEKELFEFFKIAFQAARSDPYFERETFYNEIIENIQIENFHKLLKKLIKNAVNKEFLILSPKKESKIIK